MAKETHKRIIVWLNQQGIENNLKSVRAAISKTTNEMAKLPAFSDEWYRKSQKLSKLKDIYLEMQNEVKATSKEIENAGESLNKTIINIGALGSAYTAASAAVQHFVSATQEYVDAYAKLDDAMTNVSKYTGLTREEVKQLNEEFRQMDTRTPTEKLNALAADAGRLGITSKEAIKDFVEAADIINVALGEDLGEDAVKNIGKMATMFGESDKMGLRGAMIATASAVNTLAQSSSASEPYIMDFSARLAGVANTAGITQAHIMGIASAMDQNMAQVEKSATAVQKIMMDMMSKTEKYANLVGMTTDEFKRLVDSDMNAAFLTVLDTLNKISTTDGPSALAETFTDLKLKGAGIQETLMTLANNTDKLREAQQLATKAYSDGNSVIKEAAAVNGNAAAQLDKAKKAVEDAKAALGEELMPIITQITQTGASGLQIAKEVVKFVTQHKGLVIALASAYGALLLAQKAVNAAQKEGHALTLKNMAVGKAYKSVVFLLTAAKARLAGATGAATLAQKQFKAAFASTPWGTIIVAIGAVVGGIVKLVEKQREAKKVTEEFNKACAQEQSEAEYLFGKLKKAEKGTEDYKKALQRLKEKYPEVIQKHIDEAGAIRDIEQAYKDVIRSIESKIAIQMKEQAVTDALTDKLDKYKKFLSELREEAMAQGLSQSAADDIVNTARTKIDQLVEEGRTSVEVVRRTEEELTKIGFNAHRNERGYFAATAHALIWEMTNASNKAKSAISGISKQFDVFIDHVEAAGNEAKEEIEGNGSNNNTGGGDVDDNVLKKREVFQKKLAQMRTKEQTDLLTGWEKTKQQIIDKYKEMEDEAVKLYGENSQMLKDVQAQRDQAIVESGQKYVQDMAKVISKSADEIKKWEKELGKDGSNEIIDAVLGVKDKWEQRAADVEKTLKDLESTREVMAEDKMDTTAIGKQIADLKRYREDIVNLSVQEIRKTYQKYEKQTADFITAESKAAREATMTEVEKQKAAIQERYQLEIDKINKLIAAKLQNEVVDEAEIKSLRDKIELLKRMQADAEAAVVKQASGGLRGKSIWQQLAEFDWSNLANNWQQGLALMTNALDDFAYSAMSIFNTINQMQSNREQAEFDSYCKMQDDKAKNLQERLNKGLISQEKYDAEIAKMEKEKEAKEKQMKHEQFERERQSSLAEVLIQGGIAVARAFADYGWPWGLIPAALSTAQTAVQTAMISSQVNPYARGGYIDREQLALMGEEGQEWVASNRLLTDKKTAPVISALERYQRGDIRALDMLRVPEPSWEKLSQSSQKLSRTFALSTPVNNYYYTNSNNTTISDNSELLAVMKRMDAYLRDPKNRQAVISRKMQLEFDRMETEIKQLARL